MVTVSYFDLQNDIREKEPLEVPLLHFNSAFVRMKARHENLKEEYPDRPQAHGPAFSLDFAGLVHDTEMDRTK